ncbi:nucleotidyltransferase [Rhodocaloribacter litoris]|uniref:nucleotidyltransferase n=1 Tax=Rhodocaloribacter litoris TaxID=2558931 RepID=UPI00142026F7|nr:nucleotidyltransferase [Rhodocaloribacter litoris]QXD13815.1 nucleotidyltransferase [Rhodocaloribacter litoris]
MLNPDYRDILSAFSDEKVEFLLVGAYALAVHGRPRATGDIDLWIRRSEENARKVLRALTTFGAPISGLSEADLTAPDMVFQIGVAPRRIDILTTISGVEFDEAWEAREEVEIEGLRIPVISRQHLIQNKRSVGRLKDAADAEWLQRKPE